MATLQHRPAPPLGMGGRRFAISQEAIAPARTDVSALSASCIAVAMLGIAALAAAATSSLLTPATVAAGGAGAGGAGGGFADMASFLAWPAGIVSAAYCLAALVYGFVSFRRGTLQRPEVAVRVLGSTAGLHLVLLLAGLWRLPESERTFDVTLAALLTLELGVIAALGWRHNAALRKGSSAKPATAPSAAAVLGTLFLASVMVAAITTVGMSASTAGELAVPHSGHSGTHQESVVPDQLQRLKDQGHHH
ncbi:MULTISPECIES: hypothetical protein [Arthrobacter]|nr:MULTISPECIES: hypothetical protein [Arthrobacter]NYG16789.1 hypothetical protein [Arthrobacter psychrochitiniphilus]